MIQRTILISFLILASYAAKGQTMTLEECMAYAITSNYRVSRERSRATEREIIYDEARLGHLPSFGAGVSGNSNFGRGLDPETNTYINTSTFNNTFAVQADLPIFEGLRLLNRTRSTKIAKLRGDDLVQQVKDEVAREVMVAYATVLFNAEMVQLYQARIESYKMQEQKLKRQVELGAGSFSDLSQLRATLSKEEYSAIDAHNNYEVSLVELKDLMNFPLKDTLLIDNLFNKEMLNRQVERTSEIMKYAMEFHPKMLIGAKDLSISELEVKIAKSYYYPTLSFSAGVSTSYYTSLNAGVVTSPFKEQLKNNLGQWVGASLSIPLFNGLSARKRVQRAKNNLEQAKRDYSETERALQSEISRAVMELNATEKKWIQAQKNVDYQRIANEAAHKRFLLGALNIIDLQTSENDLFRAELELRDSFLRYHIKIREVNYFKGIPYVQ